TVIATGPLTNIARAFQKEPKIIELIKAMYIMGGAVDVRGNETKYAEFNFFNDSKASKAVLESGAKINLVPLDVTGKTLIPVERLGVIRDTKIGGFVKRAISNWYQFFGMSKNRKFELYDPLTIGAVVGDFLNFKQARVKVIVKGMKRGMIVKDKTGILISYAYKVEAEKFIKFFIDKINE
ncbi:nucleoside hydrolase, partial [Patescibacteria group bacterium]|nr:nucleoside hydrolase [Patescibacteria group bacterium]